MNIRRFPPQWVDTWVMHAGCQLHLLSSRISLHLENQVPGRMMASPSWGTPLHDEGSEDSEEGCGFRFLRFAEWASCRVKHSVRKRLNRTASGFQNFLALCPANICKSMTAVTTHAQGHAMLQCLLRLLRFLPLFALFLFLLLLPFPCF